MAEYAVVKAITTPNWQVDIHEGNHGCFENIRYGGGGELWFEEVDAHIVAGPTVDGETLYWVHDFGWGSRDTATVYTSCHPPLIEQTGIEWLPNVIELVDYDGCYELPLEVRQALRAEGYVGDCTLEITDGEV